MFVKYKYIANHTLKPSGSVKKSKIPGGRVGPQFGKGNFNIGKTNYLWKLKCYNTCTWFY